MLRVRYVWTDDCAHANKFVGTEIFQKNVVGSDELPDSLFDLSECGSSMND